MICPRSRLCPLYPSSRIRPVDHHLRVHRPLVCRHSLTCHHHPQTCHPSLALSLLILASLPHPFLLHARRETRAIRVNLHVRRRDRWD